MRTQFIGRWKALLDFLFAIIEFFCYLLRLRRYKRKSVKIGVFRRGCVTSRLNFRLKGYFSRQRLWALDTGNGCTTTLPLKVFTKKNFVPDFIRLKLTFVPKERKMVFETSVGDLGLTYALIYSSLESPWSTLYSL